MSKRKDEIRGVLEQTKQAISAHGHAVIGVTAEPKAKPPTPGFAYTIGLEETYGHPELIVFGLPYEVAHGVLNDLAARIKGKTLALQDGDRDDRTLQGHRVVFRNVRAAFVRKYLRIAHVLSEDTRALQVVWPDPFGKFPWEDDFDSRYAVAQPSLYESLH
ncbi:hypothetical protein BTHE68_71190 (plasmid) [Burkholderia sp. THE68]|uniref:DUF4262 domain-containing protein n=1 Tax=Burkholderia sp. THE68 TaxID=758782 RepID=UPI001318FBEF|nr:DUF4262 domain-containing protein [Burkholderia sp. THE68]BBU33385.1 hypothetical protein BTHE68_71190 [Burkholderia sp. THE68]